MSLEYTDGVVTIRRQRIEDLDADLEAKDNEQINWLWLPGQRELWEAMTPSEQRSHAARGLAANREAFGAGPKWIFSVDAPDADYVAYIDCDLANEHVPAGEANISYASHPAHRIRRIAAADMWHVRFDSSCASSSNTRLRVARTSSSTPTT